MTDYQAEIDIAATAHGLDPALVAAVVEQESAGRFHAYRFEAGFFDRYLASNPDWRDRRPRGHCLSFVDGCLVLMVL